MSKLKITKLDISILDQWDSKIISVESNNNQNGKRYNIKLSCGHVFDTDHEHIVNVFIRCEKCHGKL